MPIFLTILDIVVTSVFFGFAIWTFLWAFGKSKGWKIYYQLEDIDTIAVKTVILSGIIYLIILILNLPNTDRIFGKYWFAFWIYPFTCFLLPQLFWLNKARTSKIFRVVVAVWTLIVLHIEKYVIIVTSLHRDYAGKFENDFFVAIMLKWLLNVGVFSFILMLLTTMKKKWNHNADRI